MAKIQMTTPLVEMDGDEMTRVLWQIIKDELLAVARFQRGKGYFCVVHMYLPKNKKYPVITK